MNESYVKLFNSILISSVWQEDDATRLLWITMLALADKTGHVSGSIPGLAHVARIPLPSCEKALAILMAPDTTSQNPANEGRRLAPAERGWIILNYKDWRNRLSKEDRREYKRLKQREYREKAKELSTVSTDSTGAHDGHKQIAEADKQIAEYPPNPPKRGEAPLAPKLSFLEQLKSLEAYKGINIDREISKMEAWLLTPKGKGRKMTKGFVVNWLNKIDTPIETPGKKFDPVFEKNWNKYHPA